MVLRCCLLVVATLLVGLNAHAEKARSKTTSVTMYVDAVAKTYAVDLNIQIALAGKKLRHPTMRVARQQDSGYFYEFVKITNPGNSFQLIDSVIAQAVYTYRVTFTGKLRGRAGKVKGQGRTSVFYSPPEPSVTPTPSPEAGHAPEAIELGSGEQRCPAQFKSEVLDLVNAARAAEGIAPLVAHEQLDWSAEFHNDWMIRNNLFEHTGWYDSILASGFTGTSFGQNIARYIPTPAGVVEGWLSSPGHRANILKESFHHMGISCLVFSQGGYEETWWTQDFGS